jgi:predicted glycosyltransferase
VHGEIILRLFFGPVEGVLPFHVERAAILAQEIDAHPPAILLIEGYPFARRKFAGELDPLVAQARAAGAHIVCSIRDILVAKPDPAKTGEIARKAAALHDHILVHGDPDFVPLCDSFPLIGDLAARLHYTGYVAPPPITRAQTLSAKAPVIVSIGGGAVGAALMTAALGARESGVLSDRPWRLLGGPNLPDADVASLEARAERLPGVSLEAALSGPDFRTALAGAALSISQAGYNTAVDLWRTGPRAVLVPFAGPEGTETEQPQRARLMESHGQAVVCPEDGLSPESLARAIHAALNAPAPDSPPPNLEGGRESARYLAALAGASPLG